MEALLSRGNIFSTPVSAVKPVDSQHLVSDTPFLAPATRPTGPVQFPVAADAQVKPVDEHKSKKKSHKSRKEESSHKTKQDSKVHKKRDRSKSPASKKSPVTQSRKSSPPVDPSSSPEAADQTGSMQTTSDPLPAHHGTIPTGSSTSHLTSGSLQSVSAAFSTGADTLPPESQEFFEPVSDVDFDKSDSMSGLDEGQLSDSAETPEQTEDMTYRETVRSVRAFMGWHHIPAFESDFSEPDKSNNPWKGKHSRKPTRISVAMPPDDWLCQKMERLNLPV